MYRRRVYEDGTSQNWTKLKEITNTSDRKVVVYFEKGKEYDIVVTATNEFGEGGKEEGKIRKIMVLGGKCSLVSVSQLPLHSLCHCKISTIKANIICGIGLYPLINYKHACGLVPSSCVTLCTRKTKGKRLRFIRFVLDPFINEASLNCFSEQ